MRFRRAFLLGLMLAIALLSGCSWFAGEEDVIKMSPVPQVENQFSPNKIWDAAVGNGVGKYYSHLRPAVQNGKVFAADRQGLVVALDESDGKPIWSVNLAEKTNLFSTRASAQLSGGVTVADNQVYIGSEQAVLYALSAETGTLVWKSNVAGEVLSRPVVSDGKVLIHTSNGMLQALDEKEGTLQWTVNLDMPNLSLRGESAPAIALGAAVVGSNNGRVNAILLQDGQLIWQQRIATPKGSTEIDRLNDVNTTPIIKDNLVYAMGYNGNLVAMELRSGQIVWRREMGAVNDFFIADNKLYLVDQNDNVVAVTLNNGDSLWTQDGLLHRGLTAPVLYRDYLVVADSQGYVYWLNTADGQFVVQQKVDSSGFLSAPLVEGGKLILQARGGKVYAFSH